MKKIIIISGFLFFALNLLKAADMDYSVIPQPVRLEKIDGVSFKIDDNSVINYTDASLLNSCDFLTSYMSEFYGVNISSKKIKKSSASNSKILFSLKKSKDLEREGSYKLEIDGNSVNLTSATPQGIFYGVQTLIQLLPVKSAWSNIKRAKLDAEKQGILFMTSPPFTAVIPVPQVKIYDYPRFEYRGMHLDVVRHIYSIDYIKKYIDFIALHKLNYFHWHLTDDQGWRIENKKYPLLNSIGSWRDGTIIGRFPGTGVDSTRYGGYYTHSQIKEIVDYAAKRYITVVPEIDIPGHSMAIIASYPQFGTEPEFPKKPAITWGIFNRQNNVLAPSEELFKFLEDVFNELMDIFPSKYIHIGADECSKIWWDRSPKVQAFIKEHGLKDGNGLQHYFAQRVSVVIKARGREFVGWDEMIDDGLVDGAVVMSWRDAKYAVEAAKLGHKAILTPVNYHYFNVAQKANEDTLCHDQWVVPVKKVYEFEPIPDSIPSNVAKYIIGGQGCMWTEYFPHRYRLEWAIFPRMTALSEIYWSPKEKRNWNDFRKRLITQYDRYDLWGVNYSTEFFDSEGIKRK